MNRKTGMNKKTGMNRKTGITRKTKINTATAMALGLAIAGTMIPAQVVDAKYMTPYQYAVLDYSQPDHRDVFQSSSLQADRSWDTWFRAYYPQYKDLDFSNYEDQIKVWNELHPDIPLQNNDEGVKKLRESKFNYRNPYEGYNVQTIWEDFSKLDPTKQYFPTMEFPVGKDYCYIDGKKVMLEDKIIRNKEGSVLIPFGHIEAFISSQTAHNKYNLNPDDSTETIRTNLLTPMSVQKKMSLRAIRPDGTGQVTDDIGTQFERTHFRPMTKNDLAYGARVIRNTLYVPVRWLAQSTNVGKAEWYPKQQLAVITGQWSPEAVNYGIFKQPGTTPEFDLFNDFNMIPKQPVRVLSKNLKK